MQVESQERLWPSVKHGGETYFGAAFQAVLLGSLKLSTEKVPSI